MRLDINYKEKSIKTTNTWRLNNTFLKNERVTEEIKKEIKFLETNDNENKTTQKPMGCSKNSFKREVYCIKKQAKHQIYNLNLHLKQLEKEEGKNPKISRRK